MISFGRSLAYNFSGQLVARIISFVINMYLLRIVDNNVLGIVNVRLTLLYNTILFLTREPMRKANVLKSSTPHFVNLIWLSPVICCVLSTICVLVWYLMSTNDLSFFVLLAFPISAILESFAEPFVVISLRYSLSRHFAIAQCLLIFLQRLFVFILLTTTSLNHLDALVYAQIMASTTYLLYYFITFYRCSQQSIPELVSFGNFRDFFPRPRYGLDLSSISVVTTLFLHSLLKQLLTDGSAYVMTFTEILSLKNQAVFDAVEKLGSLVARVVLAPLEENCFAYFSNVMNKDSDFFNKKTDSHDHLLHMFTTILHIVSVIGMIVCIFGVSYSQLAAWLYGGNLLYHNEGGLLLSLYSVYLFVLSINGITECFSMASMNNSQVLCHGGFLLIAAAIHLFLSFILSFYCGSAGFIIANSINMVFRIWYSWRHITSRLGSRSPPFLKICPTFSTSIFLLFALVATIISSLVFGSTPGLSHSTTHVAIGGVLLILVVAHILQTDPIFQKLMHDIQKNSF